MYMHLLGICILLVFIFLMILLTKEKEGFDDNLGRLIPIHVSDDQTEITAPNNINSYNGQTLQFSGNVNTPDLKVKDLQVNEGTVTRVFTEDTTFNNVTLNQPVKIEGSQLLEFGADTGKSWDGNGSISYKTSWDGDALNIVGAENGGPRKVHVWDDVEIQGDLHVNGTMTIGPSGQSWNLTTGGDGRLNFLHNDTSQDDFGNDVGHLMMTPDGNVWLSRSSYRGWIGNNIADVNNYRINKYNQQQQTYNQQQNSGGGGGGCVIL